MCLLAVNIEGGEGIAPLHYAAKYRRQESVVCSESTVTMLYILFFSDNPSIFVEVEMLLLISYLCGSIVFIFLS